MKRIKEYLLIVFIIILGTTFNVNADSYDYYLSNSEQNYEYVKKDNNKALDVNRGDYIYVTAVVKNNGNNDSTNISKGKLTIRWDDKYLSLEQVDGQYYKNVSEGKITIPTINKESSKIVLSGLSSSTIKVGINKLLEFKFKVINKADAGVTKIYQMDGEDNLDCVCSSCSGGSDIPQTSSNCANSLYSEIKYNVVKSTVNKLSMIKLDGHEVEFFNENNNNYSYIVSSSTTTVKIEATKKDSKSNITGDIGEKTLKYGENKFSIYVISESGDTNTYTVTVTRKDDRSSVNTLKTLFLSDGELDFNSNTTEYTVNVKNEVEKITITSSLTDSKSKYVVDYKNKEVELNEGSNKIEIKILSEKGEERTYTLNINRALSSNNSLKSLMVNDEKITLNDNEFTYNITVENNVDEAIIKATPTDNKATVELKNSYPLQEGDNEINIKVVAASGQEAFYIINITRKKTLSKDSLLTSLKIKGYELDFKPTETLYYLKINDDVKELEITTTQEDLNATVEIEGNKNLENGSIIKINVKAEDGSFTRYFINIEKGSSGISPIIIILIVLFLLLGICIGLIIYRKKKKEQKDLKKLDEVEESKETTNAENVSVVEEKKVLESEEEKEKDV